MATVKLSDLSEALLFVSSDYDAEAYVSRDNGGVILTGDEAVYDFGDRELPADLDDKNRYVPVPDKRDLDLGSQLAFDFTAKSLPALYDDVRRMFRRRGAYGHFKDLLEQKGELENWYKFSDAAEEKALTQWCDRNGLEVENNGDA